MSSGTHRSVGTVIVGAGQGGYQVAASLREAGYEEPVIIVGDEPAAPYQRPPLSKAYLLGEMTVDRLMLRPESFYETRGIDLLLGDRVARIDRDASRLHLASGSSLSYDHLVLALGARNRLLPVEGADLDGVMYLRTLAESDAIHERFESAKTIVVIGAGFIGLELAAVASKFGKEVHVVEALPRVMSRAVSPDISAFYAEAHAAWGTTMHLNARLERIDGQDRPRCRRHARRRQDDCRRPGAGRHRHRAQRGACRGGRPHMRQRHRGRQAPRHRRSRHLRHW